MIKVIDVFQAINSVAPVEYAASYDNPGILAGDFYAPVKKILVSLDVTSEVINEAKKLGASLIVAHHPMIFGAQKRIVYQDVAGGIVAKLIKNDMSAICMHTNLDSAVGGVNDVLAATIGLTGLVPLVPQGSDALGDYGMGRIGSTSKKMSLAEFLETVKTSLGCKGLRYYGATDSVLRVAVGGGSCGDFIVDAFRLGCDTMVTADIKHNQFLAAHELGINVIDAGHFNTENIICPRIVEIIKNALADVECKISETHCAPAEFYV